MFSIHAWFENFDGANLDNYLTGVIDQTAEVNGDVIRVPPGEANLLGEMFGTVAATRNYALIETPSIRTESRQYVTPLNAGITANSDASVQWHGTNPRVLQEAEQMRALANDDDAAVQDHAMVVWLGDGPIQPVKGKFLTVRATAVIAQAAGVWRNGVLTFNEQLPVTDYQIVGMRAEAVTGTAARLILPDSKYRPGVPVGNNTTGTSDNRFRYGNAGVMGKFNVNQPPQLEMFGGVAAAQVIYLDLLRQS